VDISIKSDAISQRQVEEALRGWIGGLPAKPRKVLLLPPDITRGHAMAGPIVQILYRILTPDCQVDIMPALGTHVPVTEQERLKMFGSDIPTDRFFVHDWRNDVVKIGEIPSDYVRQVSGGLVDYSIDVEVNRRLLDQSYDLILSIGQVVPHEVVGMANYTKNILVGCGGKDIIDKSHFLGAAYGMEQMMGRDHSPVRKVFDYAEERYLSKLPLQYILTVTSTVHGETSLNGFFVGRERTLFEEAVALSQEKNLDLLDEPLRKVVVYLDPEEFRSTWLGNKAIYRTLVSYLGTAL
jgi:nickel-dependent lactate racemase